MILFSFVNVQICGCLGVTDYEIEKDVSNVVGMAERSIWRRVRVIFGE